MNILEIAEICKSEVAYAFGTAIRWQPYYNNVVSYYITGAAESQNLTHIFSAVDEFVWLPYSGELSNISTFAISDVSHYASPSNLC